MDSKDTLIKKFLSHFESYQYLGLNIYRISLSVIIMHFFLTYKPSPIYKNEVLSEHQRIRRDLAKPQSGPKAQKDITPLKINLAQFNSSEL